MQATFTPFQTPLMVGFGTFSFGGFRLTRYFMKERNGFCSFYQTDMFMHRKPGAGNQHINCQKKANGFFNKMGHWVVSCYYKYNYIYQIGKYIRTNIIFRFNRPYHILLCFTIPIRHTDTSSSRGFNDVVHPGFSPRKRFPR